MGTLNSLRMKTHSCKKSGKTSMTASFKTSTHSLKKPKKVIPPPQSMRTLTLAPSKKEAKMKEKAKIRRTDAERSADQTDAGIVGATTERIAEAKKVEKEERARAKKTKRRRAPSTLRTSKINLPRGQIRPSKSWRRSATEGMSTHRHSVNNRRILKTATNGPLRWVKSVRQILAAPKNTKLTSASAVDFSR